MQHFFMTIEHRCPFQDLSRPDKSNDGTQDF